MQLSVDDGGLQAVLMTAQMAAAQGDIDQVGDTHTCCASALQHLCRFKIGTAGMAGSGIYSLVRIASKSSYYTFPAVWDSNVLHMSMATTAFAVTWVGEQTSVFLRPACRQDGGFCSQHVL